MTVAPTNTATPLRNDFDEDLSQIASQYNRVDTVNIECIGCQ